MGIPDDLAIRYSKSDLPIAAVPKTADVRKWRAEEAEKEVAAIRAKEMEQRKLQVQKQGPLKDEEKARAKAVAKAGA